MAEPLKKRAKVDIAQVDESLEAALDDPRLLSRVSVARGKALLAPLMQQLNEACPTTLTTASFREPMRLFTLALHLDRANSEADAEIE